MLGSIVNVGLLFLLYKNACMIIYRLYDKGNIFKVYWGYDENSGPYGFVTMIYSNGEGTILLWTAFVINAIIFILALLWLIRKHVKKKLLIIEHSSLQKMGFSYNADELVEYAEAHYSLNQYQTLNDNTVTTEIKVNKVIAEITGHVQKLQESIEKGYQIGYAGIANIPAIFMLGYELGDENKKLHFHKRRDDSSDDTFHLLKDGKNKYKFEPEILINDPNKEGEILLLIQLTQPIRDIDLTNVREDNDYILKYAIPGTIDYDIVDTANQINEYTNKILAEIAEVQKQPNITQIKICVAASSAFIFALGTKFSKTQNIDTVIYHFQGGTYPWGINVTKKIPVVIKEV